MLRKISAFAISASSAATIPAAAARSRVAALRPATDVSTRAPRATSRVPTAAPIAPGATTAIVTIPRPSYVSSMLGRPVRNRQ